MVSLVKRGLADLVGAVLGDQGDRGPPEAAPGHACRRGAGLDGQPHERIQLRDRDLEIVAQARVTGREDRTDPSQVTGLQRCRRGTHTGVLGHDVPQAAGGHVRHPLQQRRELGRVDVGGTPTTEDGQGRPQLLGALAVAGGLQSTSDAGVEDQHHVPLGQRDQPMLERAAIQQHAVVGATEDRGGLVHDPGRHPDGPVLGRPAQCGEVQRLQGETTRLAQRHGDHDLERGRGGQPRALGQVRGDGPGDTHRCSSDEVELGSDSRDEPAEPLLRGLAAVGWHVDDLLRAVGAEPDAVAAELTGQRDTAIDGRR